MNKRYQAMALDIQNAHKKIHFSFAHREEGETAFQAWKNACSEFRKIYETLHANDHLYPDFARLKQGDLCAIDVALNYLSADPYYFRSGYNKAVLTSILKRLLISNRSLFTTQQLNQLDFILLHKVKSRNSREFRYYCRLARILSSETLKNELMKLLTSEEVGVQRQAQQMLDSYK